MNFSAGLREILTQKIWAIDPVVGSTIKAAVRNNILTRQAYVSSEEDDNKRKNSLLVLKAEDVRQLKRENPSAFTSDRTRADLVAPLFQSRTYAGNAEYILRWRDVRPEDSVINVVRLSEPMTRNGMCGYGSKDIRDMLQFCAKQPQCIGHLFVFDSPGGSADTIADFALGIKACRDAKQPFIGLIDGMAASAAMWVAAMMDELYFVHPENTIGSIGVYASFFYLKDAEKNAISGEVYREVYATQSEDKNKWARDIREGNKDLLQKDLDDTAKKFMDFVKSAKPNTPDEWLHGVLVECGETIGIWTKGQSTEEECLQRILKKNSNTNT